MVALRSLAETVSHPFVFRRRLPRDLGGRRIYVTTEGGLRYLGPLHRVDPMLFDIVRRFVQPGAVVWDVGANVGLFTFAAASRAASVLAIEPDSTLVRLLRRSAAAHAGAVQVLPVAISAQVGVERFVIAKRSRSTNYLSGYGTTQTGGVREVQIVPTVTLDWLAQHFPAPDVVKIDVEGGEVAALEGAANLLRNVAPIVICEVAGAHADAVGGLLCSKGYRLYDGEQAGFPAIDIPTCNTIAIRG